jgi:hypothetical protein
MSVAFLMAVLFSIIRPFFFTIPWVQLRLVLLPLSISFSISWLFAWEVELPNPSVFWLGGSFSPPERFVFMNFYRSLTT